MLQINSSFDVFDLLKSDFNSEAEEIWILVLDSQLRVVSKYMLFRGTVNQCLIHPRDIFRWALLHNASSFILAHNHPSHDPTPSGPDILMTHKLSKLARVLEIPLADHVIFTRTRYFSMADHGILSGRPKKSNQELLERLTSGIDA